MKDSLQASEFTCDTAKGSKAEAGSEETGQQADSISKKVEQTKTRDLKAYKAPSPWIVVPVLVSIPIFGFAANIFQLVWHIIHKDKDDRETVFYLINNFELFIPVAVTALLAWLTYSLIRLTLVAIDLAREESLNSSKNLAEMKKQTENTTNTLAEIKLQTANTTKTLKEITEQTTNTKTAAATASQAAETAQLQAQTAAKALTEAIAERLATEKRVSLDFSPFFNLELRNIVAIERVAFRNDMTECDKAFKTVISGKSEESASALSSLVASDDYLLASKIGLSLAIVNAGMGPGLKVSVEIKVLGYYNAVRFPYATTPQEKIGIKMRVLFEPHIWPTTDSEPADRLPAATCEIERSSWTMIPKRGEETVNLQIILSSRLGGDDLYQNRGRNRNINVYDNAQKERWRPRHEKAPIALRITIKYESLDGITSTTSYILFLKETANVGRESSVSADVVCHGSSSTGSPISIPFPKTAKTHRIDEKKPVTSYFDEFLASADDEKRVMTFAIDKLKTLGADVPTRERLKCEFGRYGILDGIPDRVAESLRSISGSIVYMYGIARALNMDPIIFRLFDEYDSGYYSNTIFNDALQRSLNEWIPLSALKEDQQAKKDCILPELEYDYVRELMSSENSELEDNPLLDFSEVDFQDDSF